MHLELFQRLRSRKARASEEKQKSVYKFKKSIGKALKNEKNLEIEFRDGYMPKLIVFIS